MKQENLKKYEDNNTRYEDDEIDLYEVVHILIKNIWVIVLTTVLIGGLGFGYAQLKKEEILNKTLLISKPIINIKGLNEINPSSIFFENDNINKFFLIPEVENKYREVTEEKNQNIHTKRKFIEKLFVISHDNKTNKISLQSKITNSEDLTKKIMNTYIELLKSQDNIFKALDIEKNFFKNQVSTFEKSVEFSQEKTLGDYSVFNRYLELEAYIPTSRVKETSSFYITSKDNTLKFTGIALILGGVLGIILAFFKEFFDGYRRRYHKK